MRNYFWQFLIILLTFLFRCKCDADFLIYFLGLNNEFISMVHLQVRTSFQSILKISIRWLWTSTKNDVGKCKQHEILLLKVPAKSIEYSNLIDNYEF